MSDVTCECLRCGAVFTEPVPQVFCPPCRPIAAAQAARAQVEARVRLYLDYGLMVGDTVRWRTLEDRAFEAAVLADLAEL